MHNIYLIDFENVQKYGLYGISSLTSDDHVVIFYSQQPKIIDMIKELEKKYKSTFFELYHIDGTGKNYLDFQMVTYIGFLIGSMKKEQAGNTNIIVVTKDRGYDASVNFWKQYGVNIRRQETISGLSFDRVAGGDRKIKTVMKISPEEIKDIKGTLSKISPKPFTNQYRKRVINSVKRFNIPGTQYGYIYQSAIGSANDNEYRRNLCVFGEKKAQELYGATVSIAREYRKAHAAG